MFLSILYTVKAVRITNHTQQVCVPTDKKSQQSVTPVIRMQAVCWPGHSHISFP
jgi:hypothetical protein